MDRAKRPEGIVFDLGGVLLLFDHMDICRDLARAARLNPEEVYEKIFTSGLERAFDLGISTEEFYSRALSALGLSPGEISLEEFKRAWGDIFTENPETVRVLKRLRGQARLFLLSNTNELHFGYARKKFPFLSDDTFEGVFLSFEMKKRKPEPGAFQEVMRGSSLSAGELFFVDDSPEHVASARELGIRGFVYASADGLASELACLGFDL